ncbi:MAG: DUF3343 domain-containing protein [Oscillospiraceae bacterium]|nr:DUF3343 domain-containing protein [Oscillospiraceae bacterium]
MEYHLIMCRSLTYAQRASYTLERGGVSVHLVKVPQSVSQTGCSYGVRIPSKHLHNGIKLLNRRNVPYGKIFRYLSDGTLEEVAL